MKLLKIRTKPGYSHVAVAIAVALVMSGGAYAAKKYVITSIKQIKPSVVAQLKGKAGPAGPQGAVGSTGKDGLPGAEGKQGTQGTQGIQGIEGKEGREGSPWTAGGVLPSGKSLKGEWSVVATAKEATNQFANSVSFALPLASAPATHFIRIGEGENEEESKWAPAIKEGKCKGSVTAPEASPGNLCVFAQEEENSVQELTIGKTYLLPSVCGWDTGECLRETLDGTVSRYGFGIIVFSKEEGFIKVNGTWAVTAK
jgi:collagen triple helix repeat protein